MDEDDLVTELIELERRIAADEYTITLARAAGGNNANKLTLEEDLKHRIVDTVSRMDFLRARLAGTPGPPAALRQARPERTRSAELAPVAYATGASRPMSYDTPRVVSRAAVECE